MDINNSDYKDESPCDHHDNKPLLTEDNKPDDIVEKEISTIKSSKCAATDEVKLLTEDSIAIEVETDEDASATVTFKSGTKSMKNKCENCGQVVRICDEEKIAYEDEKIEPHCTSAGGSLRMSKTASSSSSLQGDFCRICHCGADIELGRLIAPCKCKGTLKHVHQSCLQQWIKSSDCKHCELCGFHFAMNTKLKPLSKWEKLSMSTSERRKIMCSVIFHLVAITCVVWSLYVLIERTAEELSTKQLKWPFWTKLVVVAIGFAGGLVFMYVQCKIYVQLWRRLKAFNKIIYVQHQPMNEEVSDRCILTSVTNEQQNGRNEVGVVQIEINQEE